MARYTIREFTEVVGLGKDRDSVTRSGIILKMLCGLGIAKETGTRKQGTGRPAAVYDVQEPIVIPIGLGQQVLAQRKASVAAEEEHVAAEEHVPEEALPVNQPVAVGYYDDEDED